MLVNNIDYKLGLGLTKASTENEKWGGHNKQIFNLNNIGMSIKILLSLKGKQVQKTRAGPKISVKKVNKW